MNFLVTRTQTKGESKEPRFQRAEPSSSTMHAATSLFVVQSSLYFAVLDGALFGAAVHAHAVQTSESLVAVIAEHVETDGTNHRSSR
jgi:hypothetical protein